MKTTDFVEHPSLEIFKAVVENDPYSEGAQKAQYQSGMLLKELHRYEEAAEAFDRVVENYPDSSWAEAAKYQAAQSRMLLSGGYQYDSSFREETIKTYREFIAKHPEAKLSDQALQDIEKLNENEARKKYETAQFYETQRDFKSAIVYYEYIVDHFPRSSWGEKARNRVRDLHAVIGVSSRR